MIASILLSIALFSQSPDTLCKAEVLADRHPVALSAAPLRVETRAAIERSGAKELSEVLRTLPGVSIKDYGGAGGIKTVSLRGFGSQHTQISYDGICISELQNGQVDISRFDLDKGIDAVRAELSKYPVSTRVNLKGTIIVARDIAHAKLKARLDAGEEMPEYFKNHPILYAGPAKTPEGYPCGSMGPTTANRMDPYVDEFQDHGASLVMIAKGNRGDVVTEACKKHGGFYLGTIGGVAAVLSQSSIKSIECVEYPELGMEAIWKITVEDFPAFILVDDKGNDFFKQLKPWTPCKECQK